jgi:magnesium transporter
MLVAYLPRGHALERAEVAQGEAVPADGLWYDLISPTIEEDRALETVLGIAVPSREEMAEIEPSSRLYVENGARFMTATLLYGADTDRPNTTPITFILSQGKLVTVRYEEPRPFIRLSQKLTRSCAPNATGESIMIDLLDGIIDRAADVLERDSADIETISRRVFGHGRARKAPAESYQEILRAIGRKADLTSKVRESLVSIGRVVLFLANEADVIRLPKDQRAQVKSMARDVTSLTDHATFLANKIQFLLDAMLGLVSLEQTSVIKIFSVVAVVLMPPTLVASIYGMNFRFMPEIEWTYGYPFAIVLMLIAAALPYLYFKWKRWL